MNEIGLCPMLDTYPHIIWVHNTLLLDDLSNPSTLSSNFFFFLKPLCVRPCVEQEQFKDKYSLVSVCLDGGTHHLVGERNKEVDIHKRK